MSSHSPQRARKSQLSGYSPMQSNPPREMSPSPLRDRQRTIKTQSMPLIPSVSQVFAAHTGQPPINQRQPLEISPSGNGSTNSSPLAHAGRSPPAHHLPSPPRLNREANTGSAGLDPALSSSPPDRPPLQHVHSQPAVSAHPRPVQWGNPPAFVREYEENPDPRFIGVVDQSMPRSSSDNSVPIRSIQQASTSPQSMGGARSSPKDIARQPRQSQEYTPEPSPKNDREFSMRRRDSHRRSTGSNSSNPTQSPPVPTTTTAPARTPDRSLPVQEEVEDEPASHGSAIVRNDPQPYPDSSQGNSGRISRAGHRDDDDDQTLIEQNSDSSKQLNTSSSGEDSGYTPRSPSVNLPDHPRNYQHQQQGSGSRYMASSAEFPMRGSGGALLTHKGRTGSSDQMNLRGLESAFVSSRDRDGPSAPAQAEPPAKGPSNIPQRPPSDQAVNPPAPDPRPLPQQPPAQQQQHPQYVYQSHQPQYYHPPAPSAQFPLPPPQLSGHYLPHPDEYHQYRDYPAASFLQSYLYDGRPDAPIPPTNHSQSAAPSPSPMLAHMLEAESVASSFGASPAPPAGSPYPHPFGHVMRRHMNNAAPGLLGGVNRNPPIPANAQNHYAADSASEAGGPGGPPLANPAPNRSILKDIREQMVTQWNMYALNNSGNMTDSTFSPSSTPASANPYSTHLYHHRHGKNFNQWAQLHVNRTMGDMNELLDDAADAEDMRSMRSSPSHEPVMTTVPNEVGVRPANKRVQELGRPAYQPPPKRTVPGLGRVGGGTNGPHKRRVPSRVASTQPRDTSPEPDMSSGEETAGEEDQGRYHLGPNGVQVATTSGNTSGSSSGQTVAPLSTPPSAVTPQDEKARVEDEDEGQWIDEDDEGDDEDLLELEFHPSYVRASEKRRKRWDSKWANLVEAFQALDRQTDTTLVLLAAPSHSTKLQSVLSRSIRRDSSLLQSSDLRSLKSAFNRVAKQQRSIRQANKRPSLSSLLLSQTSPSLSPGSVASMRDGTLDGSSVEGTSSGREEELKKALELTLNTLSVVGDIYEQREARWREEMRRVGMDKEKVGLLLSSVFGMEMTPQPSMFYPHHQGNGAEYFPPGTPGYLAQQQHLQQQAQMQQAYHAKMMGAGSSADSVSSDTHLNGNGV